MRRTSVHIFMNIEVDTSSTINVNFSKASKSFSLSGFNLTNAGIQASCNALKFSLTDFDHTPLQFSGGI